MSILELLAAEELEPECRNHNKNFQYKMFTLKLNYLK